ncbi:hypothetical protein ACHQM5_017655 [Ranunculus cassubicifolius]
MVENRNWSELVPDLIGMISEKIDAVEDFIRFGCVCVSWKSVSLDNKHKYALFSHSPQWLMLCDNDKDDRRSFFPISENKIFQVELPEARGLHCSQNEPIKSLDPRYAFEDCPQLIRSSYIMKAVIVPIPSSQSSLYDVKNFMVFVIYSGRQRLAFARPGDALWTCVPKSINIVDLLYLDGQFYTIENFGRIFIVDISGPNPIVRLFAQRPSDDVGICSSFYLFELYGQLHVAGRCMNCKEEFSPFEFHHGFSTEFFIVYKLDISSTNWEEVESVGDYAIFVGDSTFFAVLASHYPRCEPDCIYFTDDYPVDSESLSGHDTGIYHIQTEEIQPLDVGEDMFCRYSPPVWFRPKLL